MGRPMSTHGPQVARLRGLAASPTLALAAKAKALQQAGKPVLDLTAGEPDFPTPEDVKRAGIGAIQENRTRYTPVAGIPGLRAAISARLSRRLGTAYTPAQVIVCCGAKHALYNVFQALCEAGDEVVVFSPYWVSYPALVQLAGAKPVVVRTQEEDQFQPDVRALTRALTNRTKAIILNSPSNPTGRLLDERTLKALARVALDRGVAIVSDEIYDELVFPPDVCRSILQVEPRLSAQTVVVNGVSKTYCMTGWRIGYAAGPEELVEAMITIQSHSTSNPTSISQEAALAALTGDRRELGLMVREFQRRRDRLLERLARMPALSCVVPQGAFYVWCNVSRLRQPAETVASRWLNEAHVAVVPGEGFGSSAHVRLSFATSLDVLEDAMDRLTRWMGTKA